MSGEVDLTTLLRSMQPLLHTEPFVFCSVPPDSYQVLGAQVRGLFHEDEGLTLILSEAEARRVGLGVEARWAMITLRVHSALTAVGFLAAISAALAAADIGLNPVAGYYHDHLFVPWDERERAMAVIAALSAAS